MLEGWRGIHIGSENIFKWSSLVACVETCNSSDCCFQEVKFQKRGNNSKQASNLLNNVTTGRRSAQKGKTTDLQILGPNVLSVLTLRKRGSRRPIHDSWVDTAMSKHLWPS